MMENLSKDILPDSLIRKQWDGVRKYLFTVSQDKKIGNDESTLQCRIPLSLIMTQYYEKSAVFRLKMSRPAFNGSRDYDKLQWVFAKLMSVSRQVHIRARKNGSVWEILNKKQIQSRWPDVKDQIIEMYEDPLVEGILARYEQNLSHHFASMYKKSPMLQLLFNDLYHDYTAGVPIETKKILTRHLRDIPFAITERKQFVRVDTPNNEVVISLDGRPDRTRIDEEAMNRYLGEVVGNRPSAPYHFNYEGAYRMDTARGGIREATLTVEGTLGDAYKKSTNYKLIGTDN